jgi:hypothetical protein
LEEKKNVYRVLVGKREEKRRLGKPRRKWVDNIKINLRFMVWGGMDLIDVAQDRDQWRDFVYTVIDPQFP